MAMGMTACNRNEEPEVFERMKYIREIEPKSKYVDWKAMTPDERKQYPRKGCAINSPAEFPEDAVFGLDDIRSADIDFSKETLLLNYILVPGYVQGHNVIWGYNHPTETYEFYTWFNLTDSERDDLFTYYRSAIVVDKLSPDTPVQFTASY